MPYYHKIDSGPNKGQWTNGSHVVDKDAAIVRNHFMRAADRGKGFLPAKKGKPSGKDKRARTWARPRP